MSQGRVGSEELRQWAGRHRGAVTCQDGRCAAEVDLSNSILHRLGLAPLTMFEATVVTVDGQLVETYLSLSDVHSSHGRPAGGSTLLVMEYQPSKVSRHMVGQVYLGHGPIGKPPSILYMATPQAGPRAIAIAHEINVWCLARIGGCSPQQQAPDVWSMHSTIPEIPNLLGGILRSEDAAVAPERRSSIPSR
jgi:hypothetical protein